MNNNYYFKNFRGDWITQKSLYLRRNKIEKRYEELFNITHYLNNVYHESDIVQYKMTAYSPKIKSYIINFHKQKIIKIVQEFKQIYNINIINKNLLQFQRKIATKKIIYNEYIYEINDNLKISIGFLKKNNKYLLIIFTSYIKKLKN